MVSYTFKSRERKHKDDQYRYSLDNVEKEQILRQNSMNHKQLNSKKKGGRWVGESKLRQPKLEKNFYNRPNLLCRAVVGFEGLKRPKRRKKTPAQTRVVVCGAHPWVPLIQPSFQEKKRKKKKSEVDSENALCDAEH